MTKIKKILFGFTLSVLSFLLFFLAGFFAVKQTLLNESYIKSTLSSSGAYNTIVDSMLILASANIAATPGQTGQVELTKLTPVIKQSITPEFLQSSTEQIVNGTFEWLGGEATQPEFSINTAAVKQDLAKNTVTSLQSQLAALPTCPPGTAYVNFNPLTTTCKPSFAIPQSELESYAGQFVASLPLGKTDTVTFNDFATSTNTVALSVPPKIYSTFSWLPFMLAAAIATVIMMDILVVRNHRFAVQKIGHSLVWAGGFLIVSGVVVLVFINNFGAGQLISSPTAAQANFVTQSLAPIGNTIGKSFANYSLYFGVAYAILGAGFYFWAHTMRLSGLEQKPEKIDNLNTDEPKTV